MNVRFSSVFKRDLQEAETRYATISTKLGDDFHTRVKEAVRTIIARSGGDHVGPHGFRCRKCRPFPYLVYYELDGEVLYVLGLVQERKHPNYLQTELKRSGEK
ncbi:type II toxin-antitoxin system RelE/ParE family toxin [Actomonas aquatica]|uniref:type II toxin-antitoxin system RelE/ParE family toxin n=1 Tax=Actomonas aquatica TaxID=2866162 RepID=UPI001C81B4E7